MTTDFEKRFKDTVDALAKATLVSPGMNVSIGSSGSVGYKATSSGTLTTPITMTAGIGMTEASPSVSPILPDMILVATDPVTLNRVTMILKPEWDISAGDSLKITMMLFCYQINPYSFNVHEYVKKHNLERHFKYA